MSLDSAETHCIATCAAQLQCTWIQADMAECACTLCSTALSALMLSAHAPDSLHNLAMQLKNYGYLEDRRPAANVDPYTVARLLIKTTFSK